MLPNIHYISLIAAVVANIILGSLWYGPIFGKPWMKLMGYSKDSMDKAKMNAMMRSYLIMTIGSFITAFAMASELTLAPSYGAYGLSAGITVGVWNWLAFVAPVEVGNQLWGSKPWKLFLIQGGFWLVSLCISGIILAPWK